MLHPILFLPDSTTDPGRVPSGNLRPDVRMLAAKRKQPAQLPRDPPVSAAEKSRVQTNCFYLLNPSPLSPLPVKQTSSPTSTTNNHTNTLDSPCHLTILVLPKPYTYLSVSPRHDNHHRHLLHDSIISA